MWAFKQLGPAMLRAPLARLAGGAMPRADNFAALPARRLRAAAARPTASPRGYVTATVPVMMGRRAAKIATRKNKQDALRAKTYGRIGKLIITAVKSGGDDPATNVLLADLLKKAKEADTPKELIERNIKKAKEGSQAAFVEIMYEAYGAGGVGLLVEVQTDNINRAAAEVRDVVKKNGGKMAEPGSVLFNFSRKGVVRLGPADEDHVFTVAADLGAEDIVAVPADAETEEEGGFRVLTSVEAWIGVRQALVAAAGKFQVDLDASGLAMIPLAPVECDDDSRDVNEALAAALLELEDVDTVYSNMA